VARIVDEPAAVASAGSGHGSAVPVLSSAAMVAMPVPDALPDLALGFAAALGIGLLIGVERERRKSEGPGRAAAGVRTHALLSLSGAVAAALDPWLVVTATLIAGWLAHASYRATRKVDPGLTSEVAFVLVVPLGALALARPGLAVAIGVVAAAILATKGVMHRFSREVLSQQELYDALLLAASALIVLPLVPDRAIDPWGVLNPALLWKLVVLVMAIGAVGHIALRLVGARYGLPLAGFFAGFASSTAAIAGFGVRARETPALRTYAVAAAMFANVASVVLVIVLTGTLSLALLRHAALPLGTALLVLVAGGLLGVWHAPRDASGLPRVPQRARAFRLTHALLFATVMAGVLLLSALLREWLGASAVLATAAVVALAESHAATVSVARLAGEAGLSLDAARVGLVLVLATSAAAKSALAWVTGGLGYGWRVAAGLCIAASAAGVVLLLQLWGMLPD